jgi:hypothetical protein
VVGDPIDEDRRRTLEVLAEQHERAGFGDTQRGDDGSDGPDLPLEMGAQHFHVPAGRGIDIGRWHVEEIERQERRRVATRAGRAVLIHRG